MSADDRILSVKPNGALELSEGPDHGWSGPVRPALEPLHAPGRGFAAFSALRSLVREYPAQVYFDD